MSALRRLNEPVVVDVRLDAAGQPAQVAMPRRGPRGDGVRLEQVECVLDTWHVDDAWWTSDPVRRICHELQLESGGRCIVSWDLVAERWHAQR